MLIVGAVPAGASGRNGSPIQGQHMPLSRIELPEELPPPRPVARVERLLAEADRRIEQFQASRGALLPAFVPCDFRAVWAALSWLDERRLASGAMFCEWGSGFGVVTMVASLLGFDASGLEVQRELVDEARSLAESQQIAAQFVEGSLVPEGGERLLEDVEDISHLDTSARDGYDSLGLDPDDFDVIFTYPWPGEQRFVEDLFQHYAADGALLLTYHGSEGLRLRRKVRRDSRRPRR